MKKQLLFTLAACLLPLASLQAQLNGTYTLNSGSATSGTNFNNWTDFASALNGAAITGPVTLNVQTSESRTTAVTFNNNAGSSSTNTIKINGGGNVVSMSSAYEVILMNGIDYMTIDNLVVRHTATANTIGIRLANNATYNTISKCTIDFTSLTTASTSATAGIAFAASSTSLTSVTGVTNGAYCTITGNTIQTQTGSPGPAYGIGVMGNNSNYSGTASNNTISNNTIKNFYVWGAIAFYTNGEEITGNDISRANATSNNSNGTLYGVYYQYSYHTNRSGKVENNNIHDLPFVGATTSNANSSFLGLYVPYNYANSTRRFIVKDNKIQKIRITSGTYYGIYGIYNDYTTYQGNLIEDNRRDGTSYFYGMYLYYGSFPWVIGNTINNNYNTNSQYWYGIYSAYQTGTDNRMWDNQITNNITTGTQYYWYGLYMDNFSTTSTWTTLRNKITGNDAGTYYVYNYDIYSYYYINNTIASNITAANKGYYHYGIYSYLPTTSITLKIIQNTIVIDHNGFWYTYNYCFPVYIGNYGNLYVRGNIFMMQNAYYGYPAYTYGGGATYYKEWDHNTYYVNNVWGGQYWYNLNGGYGDFAGWYNSGFAGPNENYMDPKFVNYSGGNYKSNRWWTQNNVPTNLSENPSDQLNVARNIIMSDRGAVENYTDLQNMGSDFTVPATVCSGWEGKANITVKNLFIDSAIRFKVSYSVNNGPKTTVVCPKKLLTNDTAKIWFPVPVRLNAPGTARIAIYIDIPDDNRSNDSFIRTTTVLPAPGGGKYAVSSTPTNANYNMGKSFSVTQVNMPVYFTVNAPRAYSNATYWNGSGSSAGKQWTASTYAVTKKGNVLISGATSISKVPAGSNDMEVKFLTANTGLEDSMVTLVTKITDLSNNCDTLIKRDILIYPTIAADFGFPSKICDGDDVAFEQKSKVNSGGMEFFWSFGTGVAADTSSAPEPVFRFPTAGTYKVKMTARTLPYGFPSYDSANVVVGPIPTVKFTKTNACEGNDVVFTNLTTPSSGVNSSWNFGNGVTKNDNAVTVKYKYPVAGAYNVTLTANLNGCVATNTQRVYQFPKPKASYTKVSGSCDNDEFSFNNTSTIASGTIGSNWDFNDGNYSTEEDPSHTFSSSGAKDVKLVVTSVFGCKDSVTQSIGVLESPKVAFVNTAACSRTATEFTNTTPVVSGAGGAVKSYSWNFGDGGISGAENPSHSWSTLGPKTVTFAMELLNGCKNTTSKVLNVGIQPKAAFSVQDVCLGQPAVFVNNTTWPQGDISYLWNFGDGTTSSSTSPIKTYNKAFSPNVTMYASIAGGCTDSVVVPLNIFEGPRTCDFTANPDYAFGYYGMVLNPLNASTGTPGGQDKVNYTWIFDGGGTNQTSGINAETKYNFQADGVYNVTMRARSQAAPFCECTKTKQVVMNRAAVKDMENTGIALFPNPNNGQFTIALKENFGKQVNIEITSMAGVLIKKISADNTGAISVNTGDIADGVYLVRVQSGENTAVRRITVRR